MVSQVERVTTGSIAGSASADVTVTWDTAFPDTNYTATVGVEEANGDLRIGCIKSRTTTQMVVRVDNRNALSARTGTLHATAIAD